MHLPIFVRRCFPVKRKIRIDPFVYPVWAFLLMAVPLRVLVGWLGAAVCHELGHIAAMRILGGRLGTIIVGPAGAVIEGEDLGTYKNILCVLAGPAAGLLPMLFVKSFPEFAICAFLLTAYNLMPLYPLDGGRILRLLTEKGSGIQLLPKVIEAIAASCLFWSACALHTPVSLFPLIPYLREKFLAKRRNSGYNRATIEMR